MIWAQTQPAVEIDLDLFRAFLGAVNAVTPEAMVELSSAGLSCQAIDPANVSMVDATLTLDPDAAPASEPIGVRVDQLAELLDALDGTGLVESQATVRVQPDEGELVVDIGPEITSPMLNPDSIRPVDKESDEFEFDVTLEVGATDLVAAIDAADRVSDYLTLVYDYGGDSLRLAAGHDTADVESRIDAAVLRYRADGEDAEALYSTSYLVDFGTVLSEHGPASGRITGEATVAFKDAHPMALSFSRTVGDATLSVTHLLSPRIQSGGST